MYEDEDNDGKFPDESPVEVRYPRSKQEEQGDREQWPWLPSSIVEQCGPDEWRARRGARAGRPAGTDGGHPRGTASRNLDYPGCFPGTARKSGRAPHPTAPPRRRGAGQPGDRGPDDPLHDGGRGLRRSRLRRGGQLLPHHRPGPGAHGQDGTAARLLPPSVDWSSWPPRSCCCTRPATTGPRQPWPGSCCGSASAPPSVPTSPTGSGYGLLGALISAWPAVAFIGAVEIAMQLGAPLTRATGGHQRAGRARRCGAGCPRSLRGVGRGRCAAEPAGHG